MIGRYGGDIRATKVGRHRLGILELPCPVCEDVRAFIFIDSRGRCWTSLLLKWRHEDHVVAPKQLEFQSWPSFKFGNVMGSVYAFVPHHFIEIVSQNRGPSQMPCPCWTYSHEPPLLSTWHVITTLYWKFCRWQQMTERSGDLTSADLLIRSITLSLGLKLDPNFGIGAFLKKFMGPKLRCSRKSMLWGLNTGLAVSLILDTRFIPGHAC